MSLTTSSCRKKTPQNTQKDKFLEECFNRFKLHQPSPSGPVLNSVTQTENFAFFNAKC